MMVPSFDAENITLSSVDKAKQVNDSWWLRNIFILLLSGTSWKKYKNFWVYVRLKVQSTLDFCTNATGKHDLMIA